MSNNKTSAPKHIPMGIVMGLGYPHPTIAYREKTHRMYEYTAKRILKLIEKKRPIFRQMDISDVIGFATDFVKGDYHGVSQSEANDMEEWLEELQNRLKDPKTVIIDDAPPFGNDRYDMRNYIVGRYNTIIDHYEDWIKLLEEDSHGGLSETEIKRLTIYSLGKNKILDLEKLVNNVIKYNVFTYNEVYNRTLRSKTFFEDAKKTRRAFMKLYAKYYPNAMISESPKGSPSPKKSSSS